MYFINSNYLEYQMGKGLKFKFDSKSKFKAVNCVVQKKYDNTIKTTVQKTITYDEKGTVIAKIGDFEQIYHGIDELTVNISPLDDIWSKAKFVLKKGDTDITIPIQFYGIRRTNILIDFVNEISGAEIGNPDDITDNMED
jgi:hypothetical protein